MKKILDLWSSDLDKRGRLGIDGKNLLIEFTPMTNSVQDRHAAAVRRNKFNFAISFFLAPYLEEMISYEEDFDINNPLKNSEQNGFYILLKFKRDVDLDIMKLIFSGELLPKGILYDLLPKECFEPEDVDPLVNQLEQLGQQTLDIMPEEDVVSLIDKIQDDLDKDAKKAITNDSVERQIRQYDETEIKNEEIESRKYLESRIDKFTQAMHLANNIVVKANTKIDVNGEYVVPNDIDKAIQSKYQELVQCLDEQRIEKLKAIVNEDLTFIQSINDFANEISNEIECKKKQDEKGLILLERNMEKDEPVLIYANFKDQQTIRIRMKVDSHTDQDIYDDICHLTSEDAVNISKRIKEYANLIASQAVARDKAFREKFAAENDGQKEPSSLMTERRYPVKEKYKSNLAFLYKTVTTYTHSAAEIARQKLFGNSVEQVELREKGLEGNKGKRVSRLGV